MGTAQQIVDRFLACNAHRKTQALKKKKKSRKYVPKLFQIN